MRFLPFVLACTLSLAACASISPSKGSQDVCAQGGYSKRFSLDESVALAGKYELTMVSQWEDDRGKVVRGRLDLWAPDTLFQHYEPSWYAKYDSKSPGLRLLPKDSIYNVDVLLHLQGYVLDPPWQAIPGLAFIALSMAAGILLLRNHRYGVPASILVQALQILSVSVPSRLRFVAVAGPIAQLIVATTGVRFEVGAGGAFVAVPWSDDGALGALGTHFEIGVGFAPGALVNSRFTVALNFAAVYFLWHLVRSVRRRDAKNGAAVGPAA